MTGRPLPRLVVAAIEWLVPDPVSRGGLVGDLTERYAAFAGSNGVVRLLWLARELVVVALHYGPVRRGGLLDGLRRDLGFAVRGMARRPGFTVLLVTTLGLGIGANAAVFSVVDGLLLAPLPFDDGDRLVVIDELEESGFTASVSFPN